MHKDRIKEEWKQQRIEWRWPTDNGAYNLFKQLSKNHLINREGWGRSWHHIITDPGSDFSKVENCKMHGATYVGGGINIYCIVLVIDHFIGLKLPLNNNMIPSHEFKKF